MTALELIKSALRLDGILASGETPTDSEAQDALVVLNDMLDSWNAERLTIFTIQRQVFTIIAGQQAYTVGTGGNFNTPRPPKIESYSWINLQNPVQPMELPLESLNEAGWQAIPVKNITSSIALSVWDDLGFPLRTLNYWPVPTIGAQTALYTWTALTEFADLTIDNTYPPGYAKAIRYNLAADLAPEYGRPIDPAVATQAIIAKAVVKSLNIPSYLMHCDQAIVNPQGGYYNWRSDMPAGRTQY